MRQAGAMGWISSVFVQCYFFQGTIMDTETGETLPGRRNRGHASNLYQGVVSQGVAMTSGPPSPMFGAQPMYVHTCVTCVRQ